MRVESKFIFISLFMVLSCNFKIFSQQPMDIQPKKNWVSRAVDVGKRKAKWWTETDLGRVSAIILATVISSLVISGSILGVGTYLERQDPRYKLRQGARKKIYERYKRNRPWFSDDPFAAEELQTMEEDLDQRYEKDIVRIANDITQTQGIASPYFSDIPTGSDYKKAMKYLVLKRLISDRKNQ